MNGFLLTAASHDGSQFPLPAPSSLSLTFDEDSPAHTLSASFPLAQPLPPLHSCDLSFHGSHLLSALLDQQSFSLSPDGSVLKLSARSRHALLLDNQAPPQTYVNPSFRQLFERHAAPFGFTSFTGNPGPFRGQVVVKRGMTHWQVLSDFAAYFLGTTLRPGGDRSLDASGDPSSRTVHFSNSDGIPYSSAAHHFLFQNQLSHLHLQPALGMDYSGLAVDQDAIDLGVLRSRYLSLSPFLAKRSLLKSRRNAQEFVLHSSEPLVSLVSLGDLATLQDPLLGTVRGLSVAKISLSLHSGSLDSSVTLRPVVSL